jgi:hypothetical protein
MNDGVVELERAEETAFFCWKHTVFSRKGSSMLRMTVALSAHSLTHRGGLPTLAEDVRFARARFGDDDTLDVVGVVVGEAISGERTLEALYPRVAQRVFSQQ